MPYLWSFRLESRIKENDEKTERKGVHLRVAWATCLTAVCPK